MVTVVKTETGTQLPYKIQKTIQSLKELTGSASNHSDTEIYAALQECRMDANEAAQKLLSQGPFHEVRRRRDKKKENAGCNDFSDQRNRTVNAYHTPKLYSAERKPNDFSDQRNQTENAYHTPKLYPAERKPNDFSDQRNRTENAYHTPKLYPAERKPKLYPTDRHFNHYQRGVFSRNSLPEAVHPVSRSQEFRVVRDNRVNQNLDKETKTALDAGPASDNPSPVANVLEKSVMGSSSSHKQSARAIIPQSTNRMTDSQPKFARDINSNVHKKEQAEEKKLEVPFSVSNSQTAKQGHSQSQSSSPPSRTYVEGVYASASDPVHVPSPNSKSPAAKREVGVVGGHRQSVESSSKQASRQNSSNSNLVQGSSSTIGSFRPVNNAPKKEPLNSSSGSQSASLNTSRSVLSQHHASRQYQPSVGHQKGAMASKEWRPKSSQMAKALNPGVIGSPLKSAPFDNSEKQEMDPDQLHAKLSQVSIEQGQNVVIAQHIRVPENDRCRLIFGSFGVDMASSGDSASELQAGGRELIETSRSNEISDRKQLSSSDEGLRNSGSLSPSEVATEQQVPDEEETLSSLHMERYSDTGLGRESSPPFSASESQQHQDTSTNFAAYDPQTGYDIPYFRHVDGTAREQTLPSQEVLTSHTANNIPAASSMAMLQQQQPLAQMYPQVHVSHFANVMPLRQFLSPVYVPPMALPGYSSNPTYAHPSNGSSYVLMPGGSSHLAPGNMKFGVQQFKPVPSVSASGFGNFGNQTGYPLNAPGIVGNATGHEDSARLKYKDNNLYVPNPQAETSEVWIQNPREHPGMQSAQYYNMQGQAGHPAYLQSHPSFNPAAVAQSSHMQFPGLFHQPPPAIPNPHHMAASMGGSLGVGPAAPGPQVGAYQQPQLGHLNWTSNF